MRKTRIVTALAVLALIIALGLSAAPISAMPGWSKEGKPALSITEQQRDQIRNLHSAYRAAIGTLDWSVDENGHPVETMQEARELRMALRAEIFDVIHREREGVQPAAGKTCPYSSEAKPVRVKKDRNSLYL